MLIKSHRLAFDTIGLCAFNYRFNDFYADKMHPFAHQMTEALIESTRRANRSSIENSIRRWSAGKLHENIDAMHKLCDDLVVERKANPQPDVNDLLNTMLNVADPVTKEKLDDENVGISWSLLILHCISTSRHNQDLAQLLISRARFGIRW